jgi:hypothetical protein
MSNKKIPVIDIMDFEGITIDAAKWNSGVYTVMFNFWKNIDLETVKKLKTESSDDGMILCTHIECNTLQECWSKIHLVLKSQIFDGTNIFLYGNLWTEDGELLHDIDWMDYCDNETADRLLSETVMEEELLKYSLINIHPASSTVH